MRTETPSCPLHYSTISFSQRSPNVMPFHTGDSWLRKCLSVINHRELPCQGASRPEHTAKNSCHSWKIHQHTFISCFSPISWVTFRVPKYSFVLKQTQTALPASFKNWKILLISCLNCYEEGETGLPLFSGWPHASPQWPTVLAFAFWVAGNSVCPKTSV